MTPEIVPACNDAGLALLVAFGFALVAMLALPFIVRR